MNREDVIDPRYGLQQDEWSLSKPRFGEEGQLEVVGWSGRMGNGTNKIYILRCGKCSQDKELFGGGYFKSPKSSLGRGGVPCGYSRRRNWNKDQYEVLCKRKAGEQGLSFIGFFGEKCLGMATKLKLRCPVHGEWCTTSINGLLTDGDGCNECGRVRSILSARRKPDEQYIASFMASGSFCEGTKFSRSDRVSASGWKVYWKVDCPRCSESGESTGSDLKKGHLPCACTNRQQQAYINKVMDGHEAIAVKFGIARDSNVRVKQQNFKSTYRITQHSTYKFPDISSCKQAERECKQELDCGVVLKRDMLDGYTETTWLYNLEKIEEIYKRNGGVQVE